MDAKDSLHLRIDASIVKGVDALAVIWGVSRTEAANRLLREAVSRRIGEIEAGVEALVSGFRGMSMTLTQ